MKTRNIVRAINSVKSANEKLEKMNRTIKEIDEDKQAEFDRVVERVNKNINNLFK